MLQSRFLTLSFEQWYFNPQIRPWNFPEPSHFQQIFNSHFCLAPQFLAPFCLLCFHSHYCCGAYLIIDFVDRCFLPRPRPRCYRQRSPPRRAALPFCAIAMSVVPLLRSVFGVGCPFLGPFCRRSGRQFLGSVRRDPHSPNPSPSRAHIPRYSIGPVRQLA